MAAFRSISASGALALLLSAFLLLPGAVASQSVDAERWTGSWEGSLSVGPQTLPLTFHIRLAEGALSATMDSPAQGAFDIPVSEVLTAGDTLVLQVAVAQAGYRGVLRDDGRLEGAWSQGGREFPLELARAAAEAPEASTPDPASRPQTPRCPCPYESREVSFPNPAEGFDLAGTLTLPEATGPVPGVVLVSGSGPQDRDETLLGHKPFAVLADHLTREGIAVLRFDDRGVAESGGDFAAATSEDFASDVEAALAFLGRQSEVDAARIGVVGHSEGALIAPLVASRSDGARFIVLLAGPGMPGMEVIFDQNRRIAEAEGVETARVDENEALLRTMFAIIREEPDPERARERLREELEATIAAMSEERRAISAIPEGGEEAWMETQIRQMNSPWMRFFLTYDPLPALEATRVPVLAVNGELDLQVPWEANLTAIEAALERGGNPDVTVQALPGLNHLFQHAETGSPAEYATIEETMSPEVLEMISSWILARFGGEPDGGM